MEALLQTGNMLVDVPTHEAFLHFFLDPFVFKWTSSLMTSSIGDMQQLIALGGLGARVPPAARQEVTVTVSALVAAFRVTQVRRTATTDDKAVIPLVGTGSEHVLGGEGPTQPMASITRAVLPNVVPLMTTLIAIVTPTATVSGISPQLRLVRRQELALTLSETGKAYRRELSDEENMVDKCQLWIATLWEGCCSMVGQAARHGVIYERMPLLHDILGALAGFASTRHMAFLRQTIKHVASSLLRYAPRVPAVLSSVALGLTQLYQIAFSHVQAVWTTEGPRAGIHIADLGEQLGLTQDLVCAA